MTGERGATLMEVLIALAITDMLAAAVAEIGGFGLRTVERGEAASARAAEAYADERRLRDALTLIDAAPFEGEANGVRWSGPVPERAGAAWRLTREGALAACVGTTCGEARPWLGAPIQNFAYAGADGLWLDEWRDDAPPRLLRITIADREIIVAPRAGGGG